MRFEVPFDSEQPGAFDAQRITFWVDFRFEELEAPRDPSHLVRRLLVTAE